MSPDTMLREMRMSNEDSSLLRIAPTLLYRATDDPIWSEEFTENDPKAGISKARWDTYSEIFSGNGKPCRASACASTCNKQSSEAFSE